MRNDADKVRLAYGRDLHHLGDSADIRERHANVVEIVILNQLVEVPAIAPLLAGGERHLDGSTQDRQILLESFGADRVFDKERRQVFDEPAPSNSVRQIEPLVEIDTEVAVLADAVARLCAIVVKLVYSFASVVGGIGRGGSGVHPERAIAGF